MCIICTGDYDEHLTELNCDWCSEITEIPSTLTNLTTLYCSSTKVTLIPSTLTALTTLYCCSMNLVELPITLTNLTTLYCHNTNITALPDTFVKLKSYIYPTYRLPKYNTKALTTFQKLYKLRRMNKMAILHAMHDDLVRCIVTPMMFL